MNDLNSMSNDGLISYFKSKLDEVQYWSNMGNDDKADQANNEAFIIECYLLDHRQEVSLASIYK